jgi:hypothetical protein
LWSAPYSPSPRPQTSPTASWSSSDPPRSGAESPRSSDQASSRRCASQLNTAPGGQHRGGAEFTFIDNFKGRPELPTFSIRPTGLATQLGNLLRGFAICSWMQFMTLRVRTRFVMFCIWTQDFEAISNQPFLYGFIMWRWRRHKFSWRLSHPSKSFEFWVAMADHHLNRPRLAFWHRCWEPWWDNIQCYIISKTSDNDPIIPPPVAVYDPNCGNPNTRQICQKITDCNSEFTMRFAHSPIHGGMNYLIT